MEKLLDAADPKLGSEYSEREIERLMVLGLWCVHPDSAQRPSIREAISVLNFQVDLPELPRMMPVPTYFGRRMSALSNSNAFSGGVSDSSNLTASSASSSSALLTS